MKKATKETANNKKVKDESHVVRYLLLAYLGGVLMFTAPAQSRTRSILCRAGIL